MRLILRGVAALVLLLGWNGLRLQADEKTVKEHETLAQEMLKVLTNFAEALESVKDMETAKQAAPKIEKVAEDMDRIGKKLKDLPKLSKEEDAEFKKKFDPELMKVSKRLEGVALDAGKASGGEPTFLAALNKVKEAGMSFPKEK